MGYKAVSTTTPAAPPATAPSGIGKEKHVKQMQHKEQPKLLYLP
jgi:hypothetical protein